MVCPGTFYWWFPHLYCASRKFWIWFCFGAVVTFFSDNRALSFVPLSVCFPFRYRSPFFFRLRSRLFCIYFFFFVTIQDKKLPHCCRYCSSDTHTSAHFYLYSCQLRYPFSICWWCFFFFIYLCESPYFPPFLSSF